MGNENKLGMHTKFNRVTSWLLLPCSSSSSCSPELFGGFCFFFMGSGVIPTLFASDIGVINSHSAPVTSRSLSSLALQFQLLELEP
ncbi:hypothetical protein M569_04871 [Genlisea aurea]|uniref:Uncharacterized protein n=1 Tax=Genlisea aurea TaxID=192259 RepID=S8EBK4_9LAMI|nr:hypothetical protein M569_04871 [Genlisea aurea]